MSFLLSEAFEKRTTACISWEPLLYANGQLQAKGKIQSIIFLPADGKKTAAVLSDVRRTD